MTVIATGYEDSSSVDSILIAEQRLGGSMYDEERPHFASRFHALRLLDQVSSGTSEPHLGLAALTRSREFSAMLYNYLAQSLGEREAGRVAIEPFPLRITYRNPDSVQAFLAQHPLVTQFIRLSWPALKRCFGVPLNIVLEVIQYPEEYASDELVAWIQSEVPVEEGLARLDHFEDEWFLDHMELSGGRFNFNLETV